VFGDGVLLDKHIGLISLLNVTGLSSFSRAISLAKRLE
jgi:hypothetical protein